MSQLRDIVKQVFRKAISDYYYLLSRDLEDCRTILDLGCGKSSVVSDNTNNNCCIVGIDIFEPYLRESQKNNLYDSYIKADITRLPFLGENAFDAVLALDIIEHLEMEEGVDLISTMEKLARKKIIIVTPNRFLPQEAYDDNAYQMHKSGWAPDYFITKGFRVRGIRGLKYLRKERAETKFQPKDLWSVFSYMTQPITLKNPDLAFQIYCVKEL